MKTKTDPIEGGGYKREQSGTAQTAEGTRKG